MQGVVSVAEAFLGLLSLADFGAGRVVLEQVGRRGKALFLLPVDVSLIEVLAATIHSLEVLPAGASGAAA